MGNIEVAPYTRREYQLGDRNFLTRKKCDIPLVFLFFFGKKVRYMVKPSSVTKRHIMGGRGKAFCIVFTPHQ